MKRFLLTLLAVIPCLSASVIAYEKDKGEMVLFSLVAALFSMAVVCWYYRPQITLAEFMAAPPASAIQHTTGYMIRSKYMDLFFWGAMGWFLTSIFLILYNTTIGIIFLLLVVLWMCAHSKALKKDEQWRCYDPAFAREGDQLELFPL